MSFGIDMTNRNTQIAVGLGVAGLAAGAAFLAKRSGHVEEESHEGCCCDHGSISSCADEDHEVAHTHSSSIFSSAYERVFGAKKTEVAHSVVEASTVASPVEVETSPVDVVSEPRRTFLGSLGLLTKAIVLLPLVIIASVLKGIFSGISAFISSAFSRKTEGVSA